MSTKFTPPISGITRENYASLDGLRAYAAIGIVMMHVQANMTVKPSENVLTDSVIPWFTDFTLLFMVISAFSMCCGYYDRVKNGEITPAKFYAKRYHRAWPFFAMMVMISFVTLAGAICFSHIVKYYIFNNNRFILLWQKRN